MKTFQWSMWNHNFLCHKSINMGRNQSSRKYNLFKGWIKNKKNVFFSLFYFLFLIFSNLLWSDGTPYKVFSILSCCCNVHKTVEWVLHSFQTNKLDRKMISSKVLGKYAKINIFKFFHDPVNLCKFLYFFRDLNKLNLMVCLVLG